LSSVLRLIDRFLSDAGFNRAPWLAVAFAGGIAAWFWLDNRWQWLALIACCLAIALLALGWLRADGGYPYLRHAIAGVALLAAAGCVTVWLKSALVGAPPIARPTVAWFDATVLDREERPAEGRVRLVIATRDPGDGRPLRVRLNVPMEFDGARVGEGARIRLRARLVPPASPMLPGGYDFARTAWFAGLAATGSALGPVEVVDAGQSGGLLSRVQARLSRHVRDRVPGSAGSIAAAYASGDRGAIEPADDDAMRDAGLTHLLSISGLHVSAVVAAAYVVALRLLALWPWLALRVRLPLLAAGTGAAAGIGYTLLTGAEVPTVRSCIGAVLVLAALALGREALSMRMIAVAAFTVMLFWPEAVVGPSFQMSFAAVIAIVALSASAPARRFLAPREEGLAARGLRYLAMLLLTGVVIELALMPIGLFHFHRAGVYGALANVIAIPLTTVVTMPLIAIALLLDLAGAGGPIWWLAGKSIELVLMLAHWVAARPGAVTVLPAMGLGGVMLFVSGGLWLALWQGRVRLLGLLPVLAGMIGLLMLRPPDILVSGDGRHVGITGAAGGELLVLRDSRSGFVRDNLTELAGMDGMLRPLDVWPGARCSRDFCVVTLRRGGRDWRLLMARGRDQVAERALAAACDRADIVIADRWLPRSCRPAVLKADRRLLARTGGLVIDLEAGRLTTVAETQGEHGWWRGE
jgi:competence protein ComEC